MIARSAQIEADLDVNPGRYRMLTGVRPTGNMHLGHYFGTMHSWRSIQLLVRLVGFDISHTVTNQSLGVRQFGA